MAEITLNDLSLREIELPDRVSRLRDVYFRSMPEICVERPRLITKFHVQNDLLNKNHIGILDKAKAYRYVLEKRKPIVRFTTSFEKGMKRFYFEDSSPFAGSTTSRFKGVPIYPEFMGLALWPELLTISERRSNPYHITDDEVEEVNRDIFPYWMKNNIIELARKRCFDTNLKELGIPNHAPEMKLNERLVFFLASKPNCISHTIPDFSRAIRIGLRGIIEDAEARRQSATTPGQNHFYRSICEVLEGIIAYSNNLADEAERLAANENDTQKREELLEIAAVQRRVPELPAQTFREGLTTVWICWTAIHLENPNVGLSLGRLDQVLYDLYRRDIDEQTIDVEKAIELLSYLWLKIGDHVPAIPDAGEQLFGGTGSNKAITIGGVDQSGEDAVNDLTYVMLRATELMKLRDPNLNARYYSGINSKDYLKRLCEVNITTGATPALHNDRAVISALTEKGETIEQARDYGVIGCVEPGSNGRFYGHSASILLNLTSTLELTLFNGRHRHTGMNLVISKETGDPRTFASFDEFRSAFREQVEWIAEQTTNLNNIFGRIHQDFYPTPILSAHFEGPMEKGKDLIEGGATINSSGVTIIGLADVADSLSAVEKLVFEERAVSFADLLDAIKKNFKGYETLHKRLMNEAKTPKYGNEDAAADRNVTWLAELLDHTGVVLGVGIQPGACSGSANAQAPKPLGCVPDPLTVALDRARIATELLAQADRHSIL